MTFLKRFLLLTLSFSISLIGISQEIESYKLSIDATYLPTISYHSEYFSMKRGRLKHEAKSDGKKIKLEKREISHIITQIDSLSKVDIFNFYVDQSLIDSMKNGYTSYKKDNGIKDSDIDSLFDDNNMVSLDMKKVRSHPLEALAQQIDGAYYTITVNLKYKKSENIQHTFNVQSIPPKSNTMKQWMILYSIFQNDTVFDVINVKETCFKKENFKSILFRFILWEKAKQS